MTLRLDGPRRSLREIDLTGGRLLARRIVFGLAMVSVAITAIALPFASHEASSWKDSTWSRPHNLLYETAYLPLMVALAIGVGLWWTSRGRLVRAVVMGPFLGVVALFTMAGMAIQHIILSETRSNIAEVASYLGLFGVFVSGGVIFVTEWILVVGERRRLENTDPVFPTARVVR
jgi:hypothetical protein